LYSTISLVVVVLRGCYWLGDRFDRLFRKTLRQAVPRLDELLTHPAGLLAEGPVTVGPVRRPARGLVTVTLWSLLGGPLLALIIWGWTIPVAAQCFPQANPWHVALWSALPAVALVVLLWLRGLFRYQWRSRMVLHARGVDLGVDDHAVFCPWTVFDVPVALPLQVERATVFDEAQVVLPIPAEALAGAEIRWGDRRVMRLPLPGGELYLNQIGLSKKGLRLYDLYVVEIEELAKLLLYLGGVLGPAQPEPALAPTPDDDAGAPELQDDERPVTSGTWG
jgi:hypothetical protein